ncbi:hypothetical protein BRYFOR_09832 [Marvinbryantia formatexigens DSM 14469]|uniref:Uncharacterized protein n=1 Tax=Marvinbryantia formatexigens DSM 14469 TaxID=478749 RepID=C6LMD2_9FIRM|nr:hypothetical protein BRYFOR_09832 [Marvinbryantia formatexigens DSM 14469]
MWQFSFLLDCHGLCVWRSGKVQEGKTVFTSKNAKTLKIFVYFCMIIKAN